MTANKSYLFLYSIEQATFHEIPLIQKTAGILLKHQSNCNSPSVFIKQNRFEGFKEMKVQLIDPPCKFQEIFFDFSL